MTDETTRRRFGHPAWRSRFERNLHRGCLSATSSPTEAALPPSL